MEVVWLPVPRKERLEKIKETRVADGDDRWRRKDKESARAGPGKREREAEKGEREGTECGKETKKNKGGVNGNVGREHDSDASRTNKDTLRYPEDPIQDTFQGTVHSHRGPSPPGPPVSLSLSILRFPWYLGLARPGLI